MCIHVHSFIGALALVLTSACASNDEGCPSLGRHIPKDYAECLAVGGTAFESPILGTECALSWDQNQQPTEYAECVAAGGGDSVADGATAVYSCQIHYPKSGCTCRSSYCD